MAYSFDINMLRMMKKKGKYTKYMPQINGSIVTAGTLAILEDFGRYFEALDHDVVDFQLFIPRMHNWHPAVTEEVMATRVMAVRAAAKGNITEEVENLLQTEIANAVLSTSITALNAQYADGELESLGYAMSSVMEEHKRNAGVVAEDYIDEKITNLLDEDDDLGGYTWRLGCLRRSMRGLRGGDFGIVAGRPDKGKTTFIASEVTYMAPQIPKHRNILWLNNEGPGRRIIPRLYQAALGITRSEMVAMNIAGELEGAYEAVMGRLDKIRVIDIHGMYVSRVESLIEAHDAEIVVYDMIDNINGFGDAARTDLALEQMYQWARMCAVNLNHAGIATSQISADGDGEMFPTLGQLKDSKTGKQGACDWQMMIGASNDPGLTSLRYISLPKNKLRLEGASGDPRATVQFKPEIARYVDSDQFDTE